MEWPAGYVAEDEVVEADVEGLGDAGERVGAGGDAAVLIAADLAAVAVDLLGGLGRERPASVHRALIRSPSGTWWSPSLGGDGRYFDEDVNELPGPVEPCGDWGLHSYRTLDDEVSDALGIPGAPV